MGTELSKDEYKKVTRHKKIGEQKRRILKSNFGRRIAKEPMSHQQRKQLYQETRQFVQGRLLGRVFTVINILEDISVSKKEGPKKKKKKEEPEEDRKVVLRQNPVGIRGLA